jgi:hypothetical protein
MATRKFNIRPKPPDLREEEEEARMKPPRSDRIGMSEEEFAADLEISGLGDLLRPEDPVEEE